MNFASPPRMFLRFSTSFLNWAIVLPQVGSPAAKGLILHRGPPPKAPSLYWHHRLCKQQLTDVEEEDNGGVCALFPNSMVKSNNALIPLICWDTPAVTYTGAEEGRSDISHRPMTASSKSCLLESFWDHTVSEHLQVFDPVCSFAKSEMSLGNASIPVKIFSLSFVLMKPLQPIFTNTLGTNAIVNKLNIYKNSFS